MNTQHTALGSGTIASGTSGASAAQLAALTRVNLDDLLGALGLQQSRIARRVLGRLLHAPAERFARRVIAYDARVGDGGLQAGGAWAIAQFTAGLRVHDVTHVPATGPLLIVANHPGLADTVALFATIPRRDLLIVAAARPFLQTLPHTSRHLLYIDDDPASRLRVVRAAARHLRAGGAILTFPAGAIEPDPAVLPGAHDSLARWSNSIDVLARLAIDLAIVPAIVSGVVSPRALAHPLTRLRRRAADRHWLAAIIQIQRRALQQVVIDVRFGRPIHATRDTAAATLRQQVLSEAAGLINNSRRQV